MVPKPSSTEAGLVHSPTVEESSEWYQGLESNRIRKFTVDRRLIRNFTVDRRLVRKFSSQRSEWRKYKPHRQRNAMELLRADVVKREMREGTPARQFTVDRRLIPKFTIDRRLIRKFIVDRRLVRKFTIDRRPFKSCSLVARNILRTVFVAAMGVAVATLVVVVVDS